MATPSRNDTMIKNLMKKRRSRIKEIKIENKQKDPEDIKRIIEMWERAKEQK